MNSSYFGFARLSAFLLALAVGLFGFACAVNDQEPDAGHAPEAEMATETEVETSTPDDDATHGPASLIGAIREDYLRANITSIAEEAFPDNVGLKWNIIGIDRMYEIMYPEVAPEPDEVGYSRLKFVVSFADEEAPVEIGCYVLGESGWTLLYGEDPRGLYKTQ